MVAKPQLNQPIRLVAPTAQRLPTALRVLPSAVGRPTRARAPIPFPHTRAPRPRAAPSGGLVLACIGLLAVALATRRNTRRGARGVRDRALTELVAAIARRDEALDTAVHNVRTPLTVAAAQAQLLRRRALDTEVVEAARVVTGLENIDAAAKRAAARVDTLLEAARLDLEPDFGNLFPDPPRRRLFKRREAVDLSR